jgi:hypothetical protein
MFSFINVHLCSGHYKQDRRNTMMGELIRGLRIHREELESDMISDFSFVLGDTNYRISKSYDEVMEKFKYVIENKNELD